MAEEKKLSITEWSGDENFDDRTTISFQYECPKCGNENFYELRTNWLKDKVGDPRKCKCCGNIVIFKIINNQIEGEQLWDITKNCWVTIDDVTKFYHWIVEICSENDINFDELLKEFKFNKTDFEKTNIETLSRAHLSAFYVKMTDMVFNGVVGEDFGTMYDILTDKLGLNPKIVVGNLCFFRI